MSSRAASSSPYKEGRRNYLYYLAAASNDTPRWVRIAAAAFFFTSISLVQIVWTNTHLWKQLKNVQEIGMTKLDVKSQCSKFSSPVSSLWTELEDEILRASHFPVEHASNANFTRWVDALFRSEYQVHQMRRSTLHPPDSLAMLRLLRIVRDRVEFLSSGMPANASSPPPLHIMVMGGSVTVGKHCDNNPVGLEMHGGDLQKQLACAWPSRLENLFNQVLFGGTEVVKVSNLASPGASTEVGRVGLEYRLFNEELKKSLPHVVIWAHAPNDSQEADKDAVEYVHLPAFVHAARNLRLCDNQLPLVVMLDDFYGATKYTDINAISTMIYKVSSWYNIMGVSHFNVVKHKLYANFADPSVMTAVTGDQVWNLHPAMGSHIGVAWTVFFNFLKSFVDSCADGPSLEYDAEGKHGDTELHTKNLGSYTKDDTVESLRTRWREDAERDREYCERHKEEAPTDVCTYAWMINPMTGISRPWELNKVLNKVLVSNDGWEAAGNPIKQPRIGWYARKERATFSLRVDPTFETKYITVMTMKSYGDNFKDTRLRISLFVTRPDGSKSEKSYDILGFHETRTSIHVPHKFELPKEAADKGDTIEVKAQLVTGSYFKINGIALCMY